MSTALKSTVSLVEQANNRSVQNSPKTDMTILTNGVENITLLPSPTATSRCSISSDSGFMDDNIPPPSSGSNSSFQRFRTDRLSKSPPRDNHERNTDSPDLTQLEWSVVYRSVSNSLNSDITRCINVYGLHQHFESEAEIDQFLKGFGEVCSIINISTGSSDKTTFVAYYDLISAQDAFTKLQSIASPSFISPQGMAQICDISAEKLSAIGSIHVIGLPINMDLVALEHVLVVFGDVWTIAVPKERISGSETWNVWIDYFDSKHARLAASSLPNVVNRMFPGTEKITVNELLNIMPTSATNVPTALPVPHIQHLTETAMSSPMSPSGFLNAGLLRSISSQEHANPQREFPTPTLPPTQFPEGWPTPFSHGVPCGPFYGTPLSNSLPRRVGTPLGHTYPSEHLAPPPPSGLRSQSNFSEQFHTLAGRSEFEHEGRFIQRAATPSMDSWRRSDSPGPAPYRLSRRRSIESGFVKSCSGSPRLSHRHISTKMDTVVSANANDNINTPSMNNGSNTPSNKFSACLRSSSALPKVDLIPRENEFDFMRLLSGNDSRTTIMIRNIPNKYSQQMLIDFMNESHKGQYDFLYLRMDFKNKCNVGYAFCNMVSAQAIVSFAQRVIGNKWTRFNSDKVCMLSYANIQGRQALIEKFRNSSVMDENPTYRPKIFYTEGPNAGEEEEFPAPTAIRVYRHASASGSPHMGHGRHLHIQQHKLMPHPVYRGDSPSTTPRQHTRSTSPPPGYSSPHMRSVSLQQNETMPLSAEESYMYEVANQYFSPSPALSNASAPAPPPAHGRISSSSSFAVGSPFSRPHSSLNTYSPMAPKSQRDNGILQGAFSSPFLNSSFFHAADTQ